MGTERLADLTINCHRTFKYLQIRKDSVTIVDKIETVDYGKFIHIMDIEGNKIELWEPNDIEFEKLGKKIGASTTK